MSPGRQEKQHFLGKVAKGGDTEVVQVMGHSQRAAQSQRQRLELAQVRFRALHGTLLGTYSQWNHCLILGTRDHPPGLALAPGGIWGWPLPAGLTKGHCHWGLGGLGSPAPTLSLGLGACSEGGLGGGSCGRVGSVQLLRSSAPVLWPSGPEWHWALRAGIPGGQGPAGIDCWFLFIEHRGWTRRFAKPKRHSAAATRY